MHDSNKPARLWILFGLSLINSNGNRKYASCYWELHLCNIQHICLSRDGEVALYTPCGYKFSRTLFIINTLFITRLLQTRVSFSLRSRVHIHVADYFSRENNVLWHNCFLGESSSKQTGLFFARKKMFLKE